LKPTTLYLPDITSNSRSTTWHHVLTIFRGKVLDEFFASNQLHIINEDSNKTFQSTKGSRNIDLTIVNNQKLAFIEDWAISEEEICSDHDTIKFNLNFTPNNNREQYQYSGTRNIMKEHQHTKLNLFSISGNDQQEPVPAGIYYDYDTGFIGNYGTVVATTAETKHKALVRSKINQPREVINNQMKSKVNSTDIRVAITTFKTLRDGRLIIEASSKQEIEALRNKIDETCATELEVTIEKPRNPRLVLPGIPEDITTENRNNSSKTKPRT
jgi:hypothetical protein